MLNPGEIPLNNPVEQSPKKTHKESMRKNLCYKKAVGNIQSVKVKVSIDNEKKNYFGGLSWFETF